MKDYKLKSYPPEWISAHRENRIKLRLPQTTISSGWNNGGYLALNLAGAFPYSVSAGDRIYIPSGTAYTGFHTVKEITSSVQITLNTKYISPISGSAVVWHVILPTIQIYKGYKQGELIINYDNGTLDLYDIMPYELVAEFKPEAGIDGYVDFDICGYAKTVIESPYRGAYNPDEQNYIYPQSIFGLTFAWETPKYYNKIDIIVNSTQILTHRVANSAITTEELNKYFVDTNRQLQPLLQPVNYFGSYHIGNYINNQTLKAKLT